MKTARSKEENAIGLLSRNEERVRLQARKKHALAVGHRENLAVDIEPHLAR
jgi:hypothetical protein